MTVENVCKRVCNLLNKICFWEWLKKSLFFSIHLVEQSSWIKLKFRSLLNNISTSIHLYKCFLKETAAEFDLRKIIGKLSTFFYSENFPKNPLKNTCVEVLFKCCCLYIVYNLKVYWKQTHFNNFSRRCSEILKSCFN